MTKKNIKKALYASLASLSLISCSYLVNKSQIKPFNELNNSKLEQELLKNKEFLKDNTFYVNSKFNPEHTQSRNNNISLEDALKRYSQLKLINKATNADVQKRPLSIDSVAKFVDREILLDYFRINNLSLNYQDEEYSLNRLRGLTKNGSDFAYDRFNIARTPRKSLNQIANYFGIRLGAFETNPQNTKAYLDLFKEDIISAAKKYNIDPVEYISLIKHESGAGSFVGSKTGAFGPTQLTSYIYNPIRGSNLDESKKSNPIHALDAIDRGAEYLGYLKKKYKQYDDSNGTLRLTAYNQGEPVVDRALNIARANGVRQPTQIINFFNENKNKYVLSSEGRNFSKQVREKRRFANSYMQPFLANN